LHLAAPNEAFRQFVDRVWAGRFQWHKHNAVLGKVLQRVADDELKRVMVFMPPRLGKSEQVSRLFSAYYVYRYPERWVGLASYGDKLAGTLSRRARQNFITAGGTISAESRSVTHWETASGGGMWSSGVAGAQTGKGFDLGIIDDPLKDRKQADSLLIRANQREWYSEVFATREEPDAAQLIVLTRWHMDDLAGWLLEREHDPETAQGWHIVNFPAEAEQPPEWPASCTVEPDWRAPGEPICLERLPDEKMRQAKGFARSWAALYQQRPRPKEGSLFRYDWFEIVDAAPAEARRVRYWDTAGTEAGGDFTAGVKMSRNGTGVIYVEDVVRGQWSPHHRDSHIRRTADGDGRPVTVWLESEAGVMGKERTQETIRQLAGYVVHSERPTGPKELRAEPLAAQMEAGNVRIVRGAWNQAFIDELVNFGPGCMHDDQVDAAAGAFAKLAVSRRVGVEPLIR
jgi:predicted phage terminase large subunit-like protein